MKKTPKRVRKMKKKHVSISIFQGLFINLVFRSVALVTKKLCGILDFFFQRPDFFFPTCTKRYALKKVLKNPFNYCPLKVTKFHNDSVKNESVRINEPRLFRVKI